MKRSLLVILTIFAFSCKNQEETLKNDESNKSTNIEKQEITIVKNLEGQAIYQFQAADIQGKSFDFAKLRGKKVMVVNTASECGFTDQYEQLEAMYEKYKGKGFVVVGFPSNDFGEQEPGTNEQIMAFCKKNYGVTFPMMGKISVKGENIHPIYKFLTQKSQNGLKDNSVHWNFQKYLINENGHLDQVLGPHIKPDDPAIIDWIKS
ncbi:glutathione peroxidase [Flavobacterium sp. H122]|uniref:glutathione peroxidase n=1 Tax=Flavobacterium sp. H122 TaxID=2529860 RepID=UPI0010A9DEEE|nr:glutathione peroxidase [Flavobacterium sp. H122]